METIIKKIDENTEKEEILKAAGELIRAGGLVAFPTETVYGLGGNAFDETAAARIYEAKGRPSDNPLIVHISDIEQLEDIATDISESARKLMDRFWPGPMTLIFKKSEKVPYGTTGGLETVAVRMPDHDIARRLIRASGVAIAAPSANTSGRPSPTVAAHVIEDLSGRVDMIIDGGMVGIGIESTIIDMSSDKPMILRPGYITKEMAESVVGEVLVDRVVEAKSIGELKKDDYAPKAPGMKYRHYAPKAELTMIEGKQDDVVREIIKRAKEAEKNNKKVGIICTDESIMMYNTGIKKSIGSRKDDASIAKNLYGVLREFDLEDVDYIYGETFYETGLGAAIMNRLIKAAGYKIEKAGE